MLCCRTGRDAPLRVPLRLLLSRSARAVLSDIRLANHLEPVAEFVLVKVAHNVHRVNCPKLFVARSDARALLKLLCGHCFCRLVVKTGGRSLWAAGFRRAAVAARAAPPVVAVVAAVAPLAARARRAAAGQSSLASAVARVLVSALVVAVAPHCPALRRTPIPKPAVQGWRGVVLGGLSTRGTRRVPSPLFSCPW